MNSLTFKIPDYNLGNYVKPTICFVTMCKNEEHCIIDTLESVYRYIDAWVVQDTGSTDSTCKIVSDFFEEKGISGELYCEEWKGFGYNKTKLFERSYNKCDYILYLYADDILVGDFKFNVEFPTKDAYYLKTKIHSCEASFEYNYINIWKSSLRWEFCSVAHTIVKCLDKQNYEISDELLCNGVYIHSRRMAASKNGSERLGLLHLGDAKVLGKQFYDTLYYDPENINYGSAFYTAQSYLNSGYLNDAINWYSLYTKLKNTLIDELFESYIKIAICLINLNKSYDDIKKNIDNAIIIFPDRAEPYYILGVYCNNTNDHVTAYNLLKTAYSMNLDEVKKKYVLFIVNRFYGKYVLDELSVSCYWTNKLDEGKKYLLEIIDDKDFKIHKDRLDKNMKNFNDKLKII